MITAYPHTIVSNKMYNTHHQDNGKRKLCYDNLYHKKSRYPYLVQQGRGYQLTPFIGRRHQRGYGLGNIISGLFRTIIPLVKPVMKSAAKSIGRRMLKGGVNVARNMAKGESLKKALKREGAQGMSDLSSSAMSYMARSTGKTPTKKRRLNNKKSQDIFN